ncbi:MAG: pentapeptide repeat-containing protein [Candidatus Pacearchaeota archaeon]|jgi:uncharacterized protein YjbI with pentapeptide repeats
MKKLTQAEIDAKLKNDDKDWRKLDLSGADLSGADLREADLREADLWNADLSGVKKGDNA